MTGIPTIVVDVVGPHKHQMRHVTNTMMRSELGCSGTNGRGYMTLHAVHVHVGLHENDKNKRMTHFMRP